MTHERREPGVDYKEQPEAVGPMAHRPRRVPEQTSDNGPLLAAGTGLDLKLNPAIAVRLGSLEYRRSYANSIPQLGSPIGAQFSSGVVLRMGTW